MPLNFSEIYQELINEIKSLFGFKQRYTSPAAPAPTQQSEEFIASPGAYTSPIHGSWHNLGTFTHSPNPTHPGGHMGVDMSVPAGTPVYAFAPGVVNVVGTDPAGGNVVGVQHNKDLWSYYAHLSTAKVQKGDKVDQNTVLGTVGNTGNAGNAAHPLVTSEDGRTYPHLHFGVKEHGGWVDPAQFISVPAYDPEFARNPGKYQKFWLSDEAREEAQAFNMKEHVAERRVAFSRDVDKLVKLASRYHFLSEFNGQSK